jgi:hypothetical protein
VYNTIWLYGERIWPVTLRDQTRDIWGNAMRENLKVKILDVCNKKIDSKGPNVGLSFYAFFSNKNDDPQLLMEAAEWWIKTHRLDHFEKAIKIKKMVEAMDLPGQV